MGVCSVGFDAFSYVFCIQGNIFISLLEFTYRAWGSVHNIFVWNTLHSSVVEYCEIRQSKINSRSVAGPMGQMNRRPSV